MKAYRHHAVAHGTPRQLTATCSEGTGIIQNELYAGRLVWNKVRMIKDPDTGKRLSRPNAKNDWQTTDVPDLRIISQELFDAAQSRKQACGLTQPNQQRRPRHMLSGLLRCGACGSGMSTNGRDKSERIRIRCSGRPVDSTFSIAVSTPTRGYRPRVLPARSKMVTTLIAQMSDLLAPISKITTRT